MLGPVFIDFRRNDKDRNNIMATLEKWIRLLSKGLALIGGVSVVLMMIHVVADIIAKYLFNSPIEGTLEVVSAYYMVAVVFLPLAIAELRREHIIVDMFIRHFAFTPRVYTYVLTGLITAGFYGLLAYETGEAALHALKINEVMMGTSFVVVWPSRWFLPIGFGAITLAILFHVLQAILRPDEFRNAVAEPEMPVVD
tara:strand:- start:15832 stop:16422 length:591 start_codon:yes stop_codon:yes gene_type:complete